MSVYGAGSMGGAAAPPGQRPFAVFDIDGTLIRWQLYHAIVSQLAHEGKLSAAAEKTIREAQLTWKRRSHSESFGEYEKVLVQVYKEALANVDPAAYTQAVDDVFEEYKDQVYTYTRDLIRDLKAKKYLLFAISGSQQEIITKLANYYCFDDAIGSTFETVDGHFTGQVNSPYGQKGPLLKQLVEKHNASFSGSLAIGDSFTDAALLELVEQPIAFNPDKALLAEAQKHGWSIVLERKNVVYHLERKDGSYILAQTNLG